MVAAKVVEHQVVPATQRGVTTTKSPPQSVTTNRHDQLVVTRAVLVVAADDKMREFDFNKIPFRSQLDPSVSSKLVVQQFLNVFAIL